MLPIEIIGGGLAGLSLGLALRREHVPVDLAEAGVYPRHRVCGEFITGLGASTFARLGLGPILGDALCHQEVGWFIEGEIVRRELLPEPARALSRYRLDARLAAAFVAAGGNLRTRTRVTDAGERPGRIFATGRRRGSSRWLGLKMHACALPLVCDLEFHLGRNTYVGLTRIEDGRVNICGLFERTAVKAGPGRELFLAYLRAANLDLLAERTAAADLDPDSFSAVTAIDFDQRVVPSGGIRVGDTSATIPPFTGNGMAMAFQGAEAVLDPLLAYARDGGSWERARHSVQAALHHRFRRRLKVADWLHTFLLRPPRQRWLGRLLRWNVLPLSRLYGALH